MMDYISALIHDEFIRKGFEALVSAVGALAMAVALVSKVHLKTLNKTIDTQAEHIKCGEEKIKESEEALHRITERTENLEKAFSINAACPIDCCPNKQLLAAAEVITNYRSESHR